MLGASLMDPDGVEYGGEMAGLGLLEMETVFARQKTRVQKTGNLPEVSGVFSGLSRLPFEGYEIHMGRSTLSGDLVQQGNVYGTYLHGFFDREEIARALASALFRAKGLDESQVAAFDIKSFKETQYDMLAGALRKSLDMKQIYRILEEGIGG